MINSNCIVTYADRPLPWHHFEAFDGEILYQDRNILYMVLSLLGVRSVERATRNDELTTAKYGLASSRVIPGCE
jgi:hypothetical protein